jgi:hypothetical protein
MFQRRIMRSLVTTTTLWLRMMMRCMPCVSCNSGSWVGCTVRQSATSCCHHEAASTQMQVANATLRTADLPLACKPTADASARADSCGAATGRPWRRFGYELSQALGTVRALAGAGSACSVVTVPAAVLRTCPSPL